nr:MAG TPA: hypothetical protein [Bacteriophage sp.]
MYLGNFDGINIAPSLSLNDVTIIPRKLFQKKC